jgi:hypothetical protein
LDIVHQASDNAESAFKRFGQSKTNPAKQLLSWLHKLHEAVGEDRQAACDNYMDMIEQLASATKAIPDWSVSMAEASNAALVNLISQVEWPAS